MPLEKTGPQRIRGRLHVEGDTILEGNLTLAGPAPQLPNGTTGTTQPGGDNSTNLATTAFVQTQIPSMGQLDMGSASIKAWANFFAQAASVMRIDGGAASTSTSCGGA